MNIRNRPKALVLRTAGVNCDAETAYAFEKAGAEAHRIHVNRLVDGSVKLKEYSIIAFPGGFSYGDDIASGKILANEIRFNLGHEIRKFTGSGKVAIGICNGFQVMVKAGLLPGNTGPMTAIEASLSLNDSAKFEDRWVYLRNRAGRCVWTNGLGDMAYLPVAHGEGKFIARNSAALRRLHDNGQIALTYCSQAGEKPLYPDNPNGSQHDIAGICDPSGRIFGLMPHPERHITPTQHPFWTRLPGHKQGDGLKIFRNGVEFVKKI